MNTEQKIQKKSPFKVPEGYFESLTEKTMAAIREREASGNSQGTTNVKRLRYYAIMAIAAAVAGLALITTIIVRQVSFNRNDILIGDINGISAEALTGEIDTYLIENEWSGNFEEVPVDREVSTEAIIDYLIMEEVELTDIYESLNKKL